MVFVRRIMMIKADLLIMPHACMKYKSVGILKISRIQTLKGNYM